MTQLIVDISIKCIHEDTNRNQYNINVCCGLSIKFPLKAGIFEGLSQADGATEMWKTINKPSSTTDRITT